MKTSLSSKPIHAIHHSTSKKWAVFGQHELEITIEPSQSKMVMTSRGSGSAITANMTD